MNREILQKWTSKLFATNNLRFFENYDVPARIKGSIVEAVGTFFG